MPVYRAAFNFDRIGADGVVLTGHWESAIAQDLDTVADDLAGGFSNWWHDDSNNPITMEPKACYAAGTSMTRVTVTDVADPPGSNVGLRVVAGTGSTANTFLPAQVAICLTHRSTLNSRRGRGRSFIGPLASTSVWNPSNGTWATNVPNMLAQKWALHMHEITGANTTYEQVIWSKVNNSAATVLATSANLRPDTQRRRL